MNRIWVLSILLIFASFAIARSPPPSQVSASSNRILFCRKTKLMKTDRITRQPIRQNKLLNKSQLGNISSWVYWGCVGPQPLTVEGTFLFTDLQDFNRFFSSTKTGSSLTREDVNFYDFTSTPTITFAAHTTHYKTLTLKGETVNPVCVSGTSKVSKPTITNATSMKLRGKTSPAMGWLTKNNRTWVIRVKFNFTCTVDFTTATAGYHMYDLQINTRGAAFTLTSATQPMVVQVPQPTVVAVAGCSSTTQYATTGCLGRGATQLTVYGWGFSTTLLSNSLKFVPVDFAATATPWCALASVKDLPLTTNLTLIDAGHRKLLPYSESVDQVPQQILCSFFQYGAPGAEVTSDALRPRGKYIVQVTVETSRVSTNGAIFGTKDYRPYAEIGLFTDAPYTAVTAVPLKPFRVLACNRNRTLQSRSNAPVPYSFGFPTCQTGRILSYQATFQPLNVGTYALLQRELQKLTMVFTAPGAAAGSAAAVTPTCISTSYVIKMGQNFTRACQTAQFTLLNRLNPTCKLNMTLRCALNFTSVASGFGTFNARLNGSVYFNDPSGLNFKVFVSQPKIVQAITRCRDGTTCNVNPNNRTMKFVGYGFSNILANNKVIFTPKSGASTVLPVCKPFAIKLANYKVDAASILNEVPQELYCLLTEFPTANVPVYGTFTVNILTEGRLSNSTTYTIQPLALTGLRGCNSKSTIVTSLSCSNPEVIELSGTGFRKGEISVAISPATGGAMCLPLHPTKFSQRISSPAFTATTTTTTFSCLFITKSPGVYSLTLTQRGQTSSALQLTVNAARIVKFAGGTTFNDTSSKKDGYPQQQFMGVQNTISFLVEYPSPIRHFNELSFGADSNGVRPSCVYNSTTRYKFRDTLDLRHILSPDKDTNASVLAYFGSWPRFTANLYSGQLQFLDVGYNSGSTVKGPYWFSCQLNSHSSACPSTKAATGTVPINFLRAGESPVGITTGGGYGTVLFPQPTIDSMDASSFCSTVDPLSKRLRLTKKVGIYQKCQSVVANPTITLVGKNLDKCANFQYPTKTRDSCGNDVTRFFACGVTLDAVDTAALLSVRAGAAPRCNVTSFLTKTAASNGVLATQQIVCKLLFRGAAAPSGLWRVGVKADGRVNAFINEVFTVDFGTPASVSLIPLDGTCYALTPTNLQCYGRRNPVQLMISGIPTGAQLEFKAVDTTRTAAQMPFCTTYTTKVTNAFAFNKTIGATKIQVIKPGNVSCTIDFPANVSNIGRFQVNVKGVATGNSLFVDWVNPVITAINTGGICTKVGCPYPKVTITVSGTALSRTAQPEIIAIRSYPKGAVPLCTPLKPISWTGYTCVMSFEGKQPYFGSWYFRTTSTPMWNPGNPSFRAARTTYIGPSISSKSPQITSILSKNCPMGTDGITPQCALGTAIDLTIAGRYFVGSIADLAVSISGTGGTFTCAISNTTNCRPNLHTQAVCDGVRALNFTSASTNRNPLLYRFSTFARYGAYMPEIIRCSVTVPNDLGSSGSYSVSLSSVGLVATEVFTINFATPIVTTPVTTVKIKEDCFESANPIGCCTKFVEALAVSAGLSASQGKLSSCSRGSTNIAMQFTAAATSSAAILAQVSSALSNPSSAVNQAYSVLSSLTAASTSVDRAMGKKNYYACNTKDPAVAAKVQAFLATCSVQRVGSASEVVCTGDVSASGCYNNPTGTKSFFRSPSSAQTQCLRATNKADCSKVRDNTGNLQCNWVPANWRCVAKDANGYQSFSV